MSNAARDYYEFVGRATLARIDYIKHLTTLATGAIVVLSTFLEKLFAQPEWTFLVGVALGGFLASLISAVFAHTALVHILYRPQEPNRRDERQAWIASVAQFVTFLFGMVALSIFAIRNLF